MSLYFFYSQVLLDEDDFEETEIGLPRESSTPNAEMDLSLG